MRTYLCSFVICLAIGLSHVAQAQEVRIVAPTGLQTTDGNSRVPNDANIVQRTQELWSASFFNDLPVGGAWMVGFADRLDGAVRTERTATQNLRISLSTSPADSITRDYSENIGDDEVEVINREITRHYAVSEESTNPFATLLFDTPFFYDPSKGDLLLDFVQNGGSGDEIVYDSHNIGRQVGTFGPISGTSGQFLVNGHIVTEFIFEPSPFLMAGDADQDLDFDQLDLVQVQVAAKYLTAQAATWGEGDWNGAPGGSPGNPPSGDGRFDQFDIIAAQLAATYLAGPYAAVGANGAIGDGQTSVIYNTGTGEIAVDAPAGVELTSINIDSAAGIFTGQAAANLGGSFDNDAENNIFKATFGGSFGSLSFGNVAQPALSEEFVLNDLTVVGSLAGGGDLGNVDLVYVPEPASVLLLSVGLAIGLSCFRRVNP